MLIIFIGTLLSFINSPNVIYDFSKNSSDDWIVVNDGVMGGLSEGHFEVSKSKNGLFYGHVSLENNGGFTSIRMRENFNDIKTFKKVVLKLKGDGSRYQFRIKHKATDRHSYIQYFETNKEWQIIELNLHEFYPSWRGRILDMPNFDYNQIEEMTFLIANKKNQDFRLEINSISLD